MFEHHLYYLFLCLCGYCVYSVSPWLLPSKWCQWKWSIGQNNGIYNWKASNGHLNIHKHHDIFSQYYDIINTGPWHQHAAHLLSVMIASALLALDKIENDSYIIHYFSYSTRKIEYTQNWLYIKFHRLKKKNMFEWKKKWVFLEGLYMMKKHSQISSGQHESSQN